MTAPAKSPTKSPLGYDGGLTCSIDVTDFDKAVKWYGDVLGFTLNYRMDEMGWGEMATEIPGVNIGLARTDSITKGGGATLTFGVKDVDAARKRLESKGVRFEGETQTIEGMVKLATFLDPDGNVLMLYQDEGV
jgi:predicted enzyme related to lactoylglutathione lyase